MKELIKIKIRKGIHTFEAKQKKVTKMKGIKSWCLEKINRADSPFIGAIKKKTEDLLSIKSEMKKWILPE